MDTPRRLTPDAADAALRDLFKEAGHLEAPEGLEARVLARIAVMPRSVAEPQPPLVPRWALWAGAAVLGILALVLLNVPAQGTGLLPDLPRADGFRDAFTWLRSPWTLSTLALAIVLFATDNAAELARAYAAARTRR